MADALTKIAGSWGFIIGFAIVLVVWISVNSYALIAGIWDPYPFILLNLVLSCLAAIQAPIILMSQNREHERDVTKAERDYYINRKAEREIKILQKDIIDLKSIIIKQPLKEETDSINEEIKKIEKEMENFKEKLG
ncbi:MAG: DUF1003 domain-containing protein [archaeon]|nr:DUF1003 domain-containing protein [archaeon]